MSARSIAAYALYPGGAYGWLFPIGIIPLVTGLMSRCPLYSFLGLSTCPAKK